MADGTPDPSTNLSPDLSSDQLPTEMTRCPPECLAALEQMMTGRVNAGAAVRSHHANSLTSLAAQWPDAVVWPETTEEVAAVVAIANQFQVPLIAYGAGTSLEGHVNAPYGGITLDLTRMNKIIAVRPDDMDCTVEAGVTLQQLNAELKSTGLFFPVDPGAEYATLGGMAATRASGTTTVRYGSMRENVISITVVMASGEIVRSARRARKSAAGYDLTRLLVGSEGTLGIITDLTLKLYGVPETILGAIAAFDDVSAACRAAIAGIQSGLNLARVELLDAAQVRCVNARARLGLEEVPTLFLEFHGSAPACLSDFESFKSLAMDEGGRDLRAAADEAGRRQIWKARHDAFWAVKTSWPGKDVLVTDVAVPLSHLAQAVAETAQDIEAHGLKAPIVGHIGDGNFHAIVVFDRSNSAEQTKVEQFLDRLVARALEYDGTATGEHGIGQGKMRYLADELGPGVNVMRQIKRAIDPMNILNPGKIF